MSRVPYQFKSFNGFWPMLPGSELYPDPRQHPWHWSNRNHVEARHFFIHPMVHKIMGEYEGFLPEEANNMRLYKEVQMRIPLPLLPMYKCNTVLEWASSHVAVDPYDTADNSYKAPDFVNYFNDFQAVANKHYITDLKNKGQCYIHRYTTTRSRKGDIAKCEMCESTNLVHVVRCLMCHRMVGEHYGSSCYILAFCQAPGDGYHNPLNNKYNPVCMQCANFAYKNPSSMVIAHYDMPPEPVEPTEPTRWYRWWVHDLRPNSKRVDDHGNHNWFPRADHMNPRQSLYYMAPNGLADITMVHEEAKVPFYVPRSLRKPERTSEVFSPYPHEGAPVVYPKVPWATDCMIVPPAASPTVVPQQQPYTASMQPPPPVPMLTYPTNCRPGVSAGIVAKFSS